MELVTILIVTFARPKEISKTIYGFLKNQNYPLEYLNFHLADNDTSGRFGIKDYVAMILKDFHFLKWSYTIEKKPGWGNNVNTALKKIKDDYIFLIEDDREAYGKIDLASGVKLLHDKADVGLVRYDGIAGHVGTVLELCEDGKEIPYLTINQRLSKRPITYSNQPHLRHKRFTQYYGFYPENTKLGNCEKLYALHVKRNPDGPKIAILQDGIQNRFNHLGAGQSRQHTKWDK